MRSSFPEWKVSIADATAPHALEPKYPGLSESILSFGDFLDPLKIKPYGETIRLISQTTSKNYSQAIDCLAAAKSIFERLPSHCTEQFKSAKTKCLCKTLFPIKTSRKSPVVEKKRSDFLSAINAEGIVSLASTVRSLCQDICFISDDWGAASSLFLSALRSHALENGQDVITCYCPLSPHTKIDHLILPELGLAFLTENRFHDLSGLIDQPTLISQRHIHAKRFLDLDSLRRHKKRLSFNQKAAAQMIAQAVYLLSENKELHDQLEQIYLSAMDFP